METPHLAVEKLPFSHSLREKHENCYRVKLLLLLCRFFILQPNMIQIEIDRFHFFVYFVALHVDTTLCKPNLLKGYLISSQSDCPHQPILVTCLSLIRFCQCRIRMRLEMGFVLETLKVTTPD